MKRIIPLLLLASLAACESSNVRETLGVNRVAPDEFKVVSRPPLSVPPEFFLTPPAPGEPPRGAASASDKAESLLLGDDALDLDLGLDDAQATLSAGFLSDIPGATDPVLSSGLQSVGESRLLERAGANEADEEIRLQLLQDRQSTQEQSDSTASGVQRWLGLDVNEEPVVAPKAEAERIKEKLEKDEPVSGEVESIDPKQRSVIDQIFN